MICSTICSNNSIWKCHKVFTGLAVRCHFLRTILHFVFFFPAQSGFSDSDSISIVLHNIKTRMSTLCSHLNNRIRNAFNFARKLILLRSLECLTPICAVALLVDMKRVIYFVLFHSKRVTRLHFGKKGRENIIMLEVLHDHEVICTKYACVCVYSKQSLSCEISFACWEKKKHPILP